MSATPMSAGRELDALIEERVFGREVKWMPTALSPRQPHSVDRDVAFGWNYVRPYSTDIAAAWLVVGVMEARGWKVTYRTTGPRPGMRRVEVEVPAPGLKGPSALYAANAETAPLAICVAALAALAPHTEGTR